MTVWNTGPLEAVGFDAGRRAELAELGADLAPGRVVRIDRGAAMVLTTDGEHHVDLPVDADVAVGDFVGIGATLHVLERRGAVARLVGHRRDVYQVVAANVDVVLVVRPLDLTSSPARIQSLVNLAYEAGALPVVLLTKCDLVGDTSAYVDEVRTVAPGVDVLCVSVITEEGVDEVRSMISGRTVVLIGESGGGKSTLINLLLGREALATGATRSDGQGRHTTARRELLVVPSGGAVIDTPGVRDVVGALTTAQVVSGFTDVAKLAATCKFTDCSHDREPGCSVLAALEDGSLPGVRMEAYAAALRDAAFNERRASKRLQSEQRRSYRLLERQRRREGKELT